MVFEPIMSNSFQLDFHFLLSSRSHCRMETLQLLVMGNALNPSSSCPRFFLASCPPFSSPLDTTCTQTPYTVCTGSVTPFP